MNSTEQNTQADFANKTAVVFASSRGIGRAAAIKLGQRGANVVVTYSGNVEKAESVAAMIAESGGNAVAVRVDVAKSQEVANAFAEAKARYGQIDIVINAAGASVFGPTQTFKDEDLDILIDVNVRGAFNVLRHAAQNIEDGGSILQFSTGGTKQAVPGGGAYSGTKSAGELMALGLAKELGQRNINVNAISPGVTDTDGLIMPQEQIDQLVQQTPMGRLGQPEDVADVAVFLVSQSGHWITGQNVQANGGIL